MSQMKVNVLTPRGRRQEIKVDQDTVLIEILENVSKIHGFTAEDYDLRHHNKILDLSLMFRFSGLPNKANLEMIDVEKRRVESSVSMVVALESGKRVEGSFLPGDNLMHIITTVQPCEFLPSANTAVVYMRKEIQGPALMSTTLKSLGISSGRAMIRVLTKTITTEEISKNSTEDSNTHLSPEPSPITKEDKIDISAKIRDDTPVKTTEEDSSSKNIEAINHNVIVFLPEKLSDENNLPDSFFEVTVDDVKYLLRDLKRQSDALNDAPLTTKKKREELENNLVNRYKETILRIKFPDRLVFQCTFRPTDTVACVMEFLRKYLADSSLDFHFYTTLPKTILDPETTLVESKCVPQALIHFGIVDSNLVKTFVKQDLLSNLSSLREAATAACKTRGLKYNDCMTQPSGSQNK